MIVFAVLDSARCCSSDDVGWMVVVHIVSFRALASCILVVCAVTIPRVSDRHKQCMVLTICYVCAMLVMTVSIMYEQPAGAGRSYSMLPVLLLNLLYNTQVCTIIIVVIVMASCCRHNHRIVMRWLRPLSPLSYFSLCLFRVSLMSIVMRR